MLSYRHEFHAGNFADVLKHLVLTLTFDHLLKKSSPILYIDTHAGAGLYDIHSNSLATTGEFAKGYAQLDFEKLPADVNSFKACTHTFISQKRYPGSPLIAANKLRNGDQLRLYELHPQDIRHLQNALKQCRPSSTWKVEQSDGFASLKALLPVQNKRALVLVDPPYEIKTDYKQAIDCVVQAYQRMPNALFLVWYPVVNREYVQQMERALTKSSVRDVWQFELGIAADNPEYGMTASGLFAINPPWTLAGSLKTLLPAIQSQIAAEDGFYLVQNLIEE